MTTGQRIKKARKAAGMTQAELAKKLKIPFQSISQWERDIRNPKFETLVRIADTLACTIFDITSAQYHESIKQGFELGYDAREEEFHDLVEFAIEELEHRKNNPQYVKMLLSYNKLNNDGQKRVVEYSDALVLTGKYQAEDIVPPLTIEGSDGFLVKIEEIQNFEKENPTEDPEEQKEKAPDGDPKP